MPIFAWALLWTGLLASADGPASGNQFVRLDYLGRGLLLREENRDATGGIWVTLNHSTLQYQTAVLSDVSMPPQETLVVSTWLEVGRDYPVGMIMRSLNAGSIEFMFPHGYALEIKVGGVTTLLEPGARFPIGNSPAARTVRFIPVTDELESGIDFDLPLNGGVPVFSADGIHEVVAHARGGTGLRWSLIGPDRGARLRASRDGASAVISGGNETGLLRIQAERGGLTYRGELELVSREGHWDASATESAGETHTHFSEAEEESNFPDSRHVASGLLVFLAVAILAIISCFYSGTFFRRSERATEAIPRRNTRF